MKDLEFSNSGWTYLLSAIIGIAVTYGASIETDPIEATLQGAIWGGFVGGSFAALIDSLFNLREYKWNAVGWVLVALGYGFWVSFYYQGETEMSIGESIYWRLLGGALATLIFGWLLVGAFLSVKLGKRV